MGHASALFLSYYKVWSIFECSAEDGPPNRRGTDPYARWCGRGGIARCPPIPIDGREHGVTLNQVGSARFLSRHPIRKGWFTDLPPARLPPAALFACQNGRKSHYRLAG